MLNKESKIDEAKLLGSPIAEVKDRINEKYSGALVKIHGPLFTSPDIIEINEVVLFVGVSGSGSSGSPYAYTWKILSKGKVVTFFSARSFSSWFTPL